MKTIACIFALTLTLASCASLCDPQDKQCKRDAKEDAADAGAAIGAALDIIGTIDAPTTTTTTTRTCTKDWRGAETCTTTKEGN